MTALATIVLPIFALIGAGWGARRLNWLGPTAARELNRFVVEHNLTVGMARTARRTTHAPHAHKPHVRAHARPRLHAHTHTHTPPAHT